MINEEHLREMTRAERTRLAHALAHLDHPHPLLGIALPSGRRLAALLSGVACVVLAGWMVVLGMTLRSSFNAQHWRAAWIGFDVFLLLAFAATGWAFWRGRQIVIACLLVTGTLLCCDAWFDVMLDSGTPEVWLSVASAVFVELPLAAFMFSAARRLIRLSAVFTVSAVTPAGEASSRDRLPEGVPPLWKIPLFGGLRGARRRRAPGPPG